MRRRGRSMESQQEIRDAKNRRVWKVQHHLHRHCRKPTGKGSLRAGPCSRVRLCDQRAAGQAEAFPEPPAGMTARNAVILPALCHPPGYRSKPNPVHRGKWNSARGDYHGRRAARSHGAGKAFPQQQVSCQMDFDLINLFWGQHGAAVGEAARDSFLQTLGKGKRLHTEMFSHSEHFPSAGNGGHIWPEKLWVPLPWPGWTELEQSRLLEGAPAHGKGVEQDGL